MVSITDRLETFFSQWQETQERLCEKKPRDLRTRDGEREGTVCGSLVRRQSQGQLCICGGHEALAHTCAARERLKSDGHMAACSPVITSSAEIKRQNSWMGKSRLGLLCSPMRNVRKSHKRTGIIAQWQRHTNGLSKQENCTCRKQSHNREPSKSRSLCTTVHTAEEQRLKNPAGCNVVQIPNTLSKNTDWCVNPSRSQVHLKSNCIQLPIIGFSVPSHSFLLLA